jgi:hypothetical protein
MWVVTWETNVQRRLAKMNWVGAGDFSFATACGEALVAERDLAAGSEEGLEDRGAVCGENARNNFHLVIESGVGEDSETRADGAGFGVVCAIDEARDAGLDDSAGAHAAGLNRDVERCGKDPVIAEKAGGFANHDDFSVGGRVTVANGAIARAGEDFTVMDDAGADGDFAGRSRGAGFLEGDLHERDVGVSECHV